MISLNEDETILNFDLVGSQLSSLDTLMQVQLYYTSNVGVLVVIIATDPSIPSDMNISSV